MNNNNREHPSRDDLGVPEETLPRYEVDLQELTHALGVPLSLVAAQMHKAQSAPSPFRSQFTLAGSPDDLYHGHHRLHQRVESADIGTPHPHRLTYRDRTISTLRCHSTETSSPPFRVGPHDDEAHNLTRQIQNCISGQVPPAATLNDDYDSVVEPLLSQQQQRDDRSQSVVRRVHFPDDVVRSVSVAREDDYVQLLVAYRRPLYTYALLALSGLLGGVSWGILTAAVRDAAASVMLLPHLFNLMFASALTVGGMASPLLLLYLACYWRPADEELAFIADLRQSKSIAVAWLWAFVARVGLLSALVLSIHQQQSAFSFVCYGAGGIISGCIVEFFLAASGTVGSLDALGGMMSGIGAVGITAIAVMSFHNSNKNEDTNAHAALFYQVAAAVLAFVSGASLFCYNKQLRECSHSVSHSFVIISATVVGTLVLLVIFLAGGFSVCMVTMLDHGVSDHYGSCPNLLLLSICSISLVFSLYTYHLAALYFDTMSNTAWMALGMPAAVVAVCAVTGEWSTSHVTDAIFTALCLVIFWGGTGCVLWAGIRHRLQAEVRIVLDSE